MNNEKIKKAIETYIDSDDRLGFQIDGSWGTGKTYFMKNYMLEKIKEKRFTPIYVSLSGVNGIESLNEKISNGILAASFNVSPTVISRSLLMVKSGITSGIKYASDSSKELKVLSNLIKGAASSNNEINITNSIANFLKKDNVVFIFDNLERMTKNVDIEEIIGYISDLLENDYSKNNNFKNKVIIISNESNINNDDIKSFLVEKEKIINRTIEFGYDTFDIAIKIIKSHINKLDIKNDKIKRHLINMSKHLLSIINDGHINLRILFSIISNFKDFYSEWVCKEYKYDEEINIQMLKTAFISIFVLTHTLKRNKIREPNNLKEIFVQDNNTIMSDRRFKKHGLYTGMKLQQDEREESLQEKFDNDYIYNTFHYHHNSDFNGNVMYSKEIWSLVTSGFFNINKYKEEVRSVFQFKFDKGDIYTNKLADAMFLNGQELCKLEKDVSEKCIDINLSLNNLLLIYIDVSYIKKIDLLLYSFNFSEMESTILRKIDISSKDILDSVELNQIRINSIEDKDFKAKILDHIEFRQEKLYGDRDYKFVDGILEGDYSIYNKYTDCFKNNSFFKILCEEKYFDMIKNNNTSCVYLFRHLNNKVLNSSKVNSKDVEHLDIFFNKLIESKNEIDDEVHYNNWNFLINVVQNIKNDMYPKL